jgi:hypothetical protein
MMSGEELCKTEANERWQPPELLPDGIDQRRRIGDRAMNLVQRASPALDWAQIRLWGDRDLEWHPCLRERPLDQRVEVRRDDGLEDALSSEIGHSLVIGVGPIAVEYLQHGKIAFTCDDFHDRFRERRHADLVQRQACHRRSACIVGQDAKRLRLQLVEQHLVELPPVGQR